MKPGIKYTGSYKDVQATSATDNQLDAKTFTVNIYDNAVQIDDADPEQIVPLEMAEDPCRFVTSNNDEDKFSPILSLTAEIKVHTNEDVNLNTFAGGDDNRFYCEVLLESTVVFKGYLLLQDLQQDFMPDPNVLLLVATDNIGSLKDIALTDFNEQNPVGFNRLIDYIVWALSKTGLSLPVKVFNNLREKDTRPFTSDATFATGPNQIGVNAGASFFRAGKKIRVSNTANNNIDVTVESVINAPLLGTVTLNVAETLTNEVVSGAIFTDLSANFYSDNFIEAKTFEKEIGESEDCYTVLEKILGEHCRLIQQWGAWWIISIDELDNFQQYATNFDDEGEFIDHDSPTLYHKEIGSEKSIFFINEDAIVKPTMPHKYIKETFKLTTPKEIICNIDFARGDKIDDFSGFSTFVLEDWDLKRHKPNDQAALPATTTGYIKREYDGLGFESKRYAVIEGNSDQFPSNSFKSCPVEVVEKDRINVGISFRNQTNWVDVNSQPFAVELIADDGTFWYLHNSGHWFEYPPLHSEIVPIPYSYSDAGDDKREWTDLSVTSFEIPKTGVLYLYLIQKDNSTTMNWSNLSFNYYAYINNGFAPVKEQYHKISATVNNKIKREKEVFISDSPRKIFKGGLFKPLYDDFILVETFYKGNIYINNDPPDDQLKRFGEWQAWWVWNQYRLCNREFDFTAQGLDTNTEKDSKANLVTPVHKFFLMDGNESTWGRYFMLLHHEANTHLGEWEGFLSEVYKEDEGKNYGTTSSTGDPILGQWWEFIYDAGPTLTAYFLLVQNATPAGYYRQNTPSVPPYPATADLDNDFTYVGDDIQSILDYLGINIDDMISFLDNSETTNVTTVTTIIIAVHEFKYVLE